MEVRHEQSRESAAVVSGLAAALQQSKTLLDVKKINKIAGCHHWLSVTVLTVQYFELMFIHQPVRPVCLLLDILH